MKRYLALVFISLNAFGSYKKVYQDFLVGDAVKALYSKYKIQQLEQKEQKFQFDWNFKFGVQRSDSFLDSLYSFQSRHTKANSGFLELSRSSFKYGSFKFKHEQSHFDLSNWPTNSLQGLESDSLYESKNTFQYEYDFLKDEGQKAWDIIEVTQKKKQLEFQKELEKEFLDFFSTYLSFKLHGMLRLEYERFTKKAETRVTELKRRMKDGLARKTDFYQAQLALISRQEQVITNLNQLEEQKQKLEQYLGQQSLVDLNESMSWSDKTILFFENYLTQGNNLDTQIQYENLKLVELEGKKEIASQSHSLVLNLALTKNSFKSQANNAFHDSWSQNKREEKIMGLTYAYPLGGRKIKVTKQKVNIKSMYQEIQLKRQKKKFFSTQKSLRNLIQGYARKIKLNRQKVKLTKKSLGEYQRRYKQGQVSFDDLLRSDETYISAKIERLQLLYQFEKTVSSLAYLQGNMRELLANYLD